MFIVRLFDFNQVNLIFIKRNVLSETLNNHGHIKALTNNDATAQKPNDKRIATTGIRLLGRLP